MVLTNIVFSYIFYLNITREHSLRFPFRKKSRNAQELLLIPRNCHEFASQNGNFSTFRSVQCAVFTSVYIQYLHI